MKYCVVTADSAGSMEVSYVKAESDLQAIEAVVVNIVAAHGADLRSVLVLAGDATVYRGPCFIADLVEGD
jgi:hypothetical protein